MVRVIGSRCSTATRIYMEENSFSLTKNINRANCLLLSTDYSNWLHENGHKSYDRDQLYNSERAYSLKASVSNEHRQRK